MNTPHFVAEGNPEEEVNESREILSRSGCALHHYIEEITTQIDHFHAVVLPGYEGLEYFLYY